MISKDHDRSHPIFRATKPPKHLELGLGWLVPALALHSWPRPLHADFLFQSAHQTHAAESV